MSLRVNQGSLLTLLDKLTHLILSDFNIVDPEKQKEELAQFVQTFTKHDGLEFHEALALVQLPDLSKADPVVSMGAIQTLFKNLKVEHKVKKIVKLIIRRDHPTQPTHDWYISALVRDFEIEILDWQKADFDLHYLANPPKDGMPNKPVFLRDLHLYSSGHEGPLYSWTGKDGLIQLPFVSFLILDYKRIYSTFITTRFATNF
jgi:hypothetical protein